jgi:hypothetical protein
MIIFADRKNQRKKNSKYKMINLGENERNSKTIVNKNIPLFKIRTKKSFGSIVSIVFSYSK